LVFFQGIAGGTAAKATKGTHLALKFENAVDLDTGVVLEGPIRLGEVADTANLGPMVGRRPDRSIPPPTQRSRAFRDRARPRPHLERCPFGQCLRKRPEFVDLARRILGYKQTPSTALGPDRTDHDSVDEYKKATHPGTSNADHAEVPKAASLKNGSPVASGQEGLDRIDGNQPPAADFNTSQRADADELV
jgi:hypothetical protein